jgi:sugar-specific transcriptional regulator TrmB
MTYPAPPFPLEQLQSLGLTKSQAQAYLTLVRLGRATALQIAREANLQRTEIYRLMEELTSLGLVESTLDKPRRFRASEFCKSIPALAQKIAARYENVVSGSKQLATKLEELAASVRGEIRPSIHVMTGFDRIKEEFMESLEETKQEVWIAMSAAQLARPTVEYVGELSKAIAARELKVRAVVQVDRSSLSLLKNLPACSETRQLSTLDLFFYGFDSHTVCIGMTPAQIRTPVPTYLRVVNYPLASAMRSFFNTLWNQAIPSGTQTAVLRQSARSRTRLVWGQEEAYALVRPWPRKAKKRLAVFLYPETPTPLFPFTHVFGKPLKRNLKLQALSFVTQQNSQLFRELSEIGEVRHINVSFPFTIGLLDNSEAILVLAFPDTSNLNTPLYVTVHITKPRMVKGLAEMFGALWKRSIQFDTRIRRLQNRNN